MMKRVLLKKPQTYLLFVLSFTLGGCANLFPFEPCECEQAQEVFEEESSEEESVQVATMAPIPDPASALDARDVRPLRKLPDGRLVIGAVETVLIDPPGFKLDARVDSGANTSSLDARDLVIFERDGKRWARFNVLPADGTEPAEVERPVKRFVRVSQTNSPESDRRPVIELAIEMGGNREIIDFNLRDRSKMTYPVLLGRQYLLDRAVIDISRQHIQE